MTVTESALNKWMKKIGYPITDFFYACFDINTLEDDVWQAQNKQA